MLHTCLKVLLKYGQQKDFYKKEEVIMPRLVGQSL